MRHASRTSCRWVWAIIMTAVAAVNFVFHGDDVAAVNFVVHGDDVAAVNFVVHGESPDQLMIS